MTKLRDPGTFADAVTRVVGVITWAKAADVVGKSERTVRNWSEGNTGALPTIEEALLLDAAYLAAGGGHAPLMQAYELMLKNMTEARADAAAIAAMIAPTAREGGEAVAALADASRPDADEATRALAGRECMEAAEAFTNAARKLLRRPDVQ